MTPLEQVQEIRDVVREYRRSVEPAPYTTERALVERIEATLARDWDPMAGVLDDHDNNVEWPDQMRPRSAMAVARNIVNQILDEAGTDIDTRQRINDTCDQFTARLLVTYATDGAA